MRPMKTDYGILRDRAAELIVASAALLDGIGVGFSTAWMSLDDLELRMVRVDEAYKKLDHEWNRLVEQSIEDERRKSA